MAGDWIKILTCTPDKPEIFALAALLEIDADAVLGKCVRLWVWADAQLDGNAVSVTETLPQRYQSVSETLPERYRVAVFALIDRVTACVGFAEALEKVGWLATDGGRVVFTNFDKHNGNTAKTRANTAQRVARHKQRSARSGNASGNALVTVQALPREEKRREENIINTLESTNETPVFFLADGRHEPVPRQHWDAWVAAYGAERVGRELTRCNLWVSTNPKKQSKAVSGAVRRFNAWLARSADSAGAAVADELTIDSIFGQGSAKI